MKLNCCVNLVDLNLNAKTLSRPLKGIVSVGFRSSTKPEQGSVPLILVATAADKNGHKFLIEENIDRIFEKFTQQGKCTIRFKKPNKDVMISDALPADLKTFLQIVRSVISKKENVTQLNVLLPVEKEDIKPKQLKMTIRKREEYPVTKSFPGSLEELFIESSCCLKRIEARILSIRNLVKLSIPNQQITDIPPGIGLTRLKYLNLSGNKISAFPELAESCFTQSLVSLDLSYNELQTVPEAALKMTKLMELRLSHNRILELPAELAKLSFLKKVKAAHNLFNFLPSSFVRRKFVELDLYGNPWISVEASTQNSVQLETSQDAINSLFLKSLYALRKWLNGRNLINFEFLQDFLPQHLISQLKNCEECICGSFVLNARRIISHVEISEFCEIVISVNNRGTTTVPVSFVVCSETCERKLMNHSRV